MVAQNARFHVSLVFTVEHMHAGPDIRLDILPRYLSPRQKRQSIRLTRRISCSWLCCVLEVDMSSRRTYGQ